MGRLETCFALIEGGGFPIRPCYVSVGTLMTMICRTVKFLTFHNLLGLGHHLHLYLS